MRLRESFGDEFRAAQDHQIRAEHAIAKASVAIEEISARLAVITPARALLEAAERIKALQERLGAIEKASRDRVTIVGLQQENEHQGRRLLRELGRATDLEETESLRLRADEPAIIRALGQKFAELRGQADEARRTIARHDDQIKNREIELSELEQPIDVDLLRRSVRQARKAGDLEARLSQAQGKLAVRRKTQQRPL